METKAHHVLIGAFVLLALLGGMGFALWVAKVSLDDEFTEYDVVFTETVTGLTKGASVNFNGIQVGEVRRLSLDKADASRVLARIRVDSSTPVKRDTVARMTFTGLTGVVIIELVAGAPDAPPLLIAQGATVGVIIGEPSALQKMMTDGGNVLLRLSTAMERVTEVLSEENTQRITRVIGHIESITAQVDSDETGLGSALAQATQALADLGEASTAVKALAARAEQTLQGADGMLARDLKPAAAELRETLSALKAISARVDTLLARNSAQIEQFAQAGLPDLNQALKELGTLTASLNRISKRLEETPADYLLQRDRPREYRRK